LSSTKYTYAVARIRALETALFDASVIEQLLACSTEQQCIQLLQEKGWGDADTPAKAEAILDREQEKAWETIRDLHVDMSVFDVFSYPNLFHNLKAAVKEACTSQNGRNRMRIPIFHRMKCWILSAAKNFPDFLNIWRARQRKLMKPFFIQETGSCVM